MSTATLERPAPLADRLAELDRFTLKSGGHKNLDDGVCAMELVSYLANEPYSDSPQCTCPVIAEFVRRWNDCLPTDAERDRILKPLLPKLIGTRTTGDSERRSLLALDWLIREHLPAWLDAAKLTEEAAALRAAEPITSRATAKAINPLVLRARDKADAAWDAAWDAAGDALRNKVYSAVYAAVRKVLDPIVSAIQASATALLTRMIEAA